jgi:hypothetical protein
MSQQPEDIMGTRGAIGFRANGTDHVVYNHFDSYPSDLGANMIDFIKTYRAEHGKDFVKNLNSDVQHMIPIQEDQKPDDKAKVFLKMLGVVNLGVGEQSTDDWYCLLRGTQGKPGMILKARYYTPANDFLRDSLFCEYAYIINLDDEVLEFYVGFNLVGQKFKNPGRYWPLGPLEREGGAAREYGPVVLRKSFPLKDVAKGNVNKIVSEMTEAERVHSRSRDRFSARQKTAA